MSISAKDRERISNAIRAAETKTSGEIVCVLAQASSNTTTLSVLLAALGALALPWVLVMLTAMPVYRILSLQIIAFMILMGAFCWTPVRTALMPRRLRRAAAHRVAMEQFQARGIARKDDRTGVLIFVSLAERYARIIADDGIAARVPQAQWQAAVDVLIVHMRGGRIAEGFIAAIAICGDELAKNFPPIEGRHRQLRDRIYLI